MDGWMFCVRMCGGESMCCSHRALYALRRLFKVALGLQMPRKLLRYGGIAVERDVPCRDAVLREVTTLRIARNGCAVSWNPVASGHGERERQRDRETETIRTRQRQDRETETEREKQRAITVRLSDRVAVYESRDQV